MSQPDTTNIAKHFSRSWKTYNQTASVQSEIARKTISLLTRYSGRRFEKILEIGCGSGLLTREISRHLDYRQLYLNDLCPNCAEYIPESPKIFWRFGNAETIGYPSSLNLVLSCSCFQWLENPARVFAKVHQALDKNGIFCFSSFGPENFREIRQLCGNGLTYLSASECRDLLQPYFQILHSEESISELYFSDVKKLLQHLKDTGVNGISSQRWSKRQYFDFMDNYTRLFSNERGVRISYHPTFFVLKKH